jgi:hypothetical protein
VTVPRLPTRTVYGTSKTVALTATGVPAAFTTSMRWVASVTGVTLGVSPFGEPGSVLPLVDWSTFQALAGGVGVPPG